MIHLNPWIIECYDMIKTFQIPVFISQYNLFPIYAKPEATATADRVFTTKNLIN